MTVCQPLVAPAGHLVSSSQSGFFFLGKLPGNKDQKVSEDMGDGCEQTPPCLCIEMEGCYKLRWF